MDVSKRLQELMDKYGFTQYRLCKESGLNQSSISRYLNGQNSPTAEQLERICNAIGITLAEFFSGDEEPEIFTDARELRFDALHQLVDEVPEDRREEVKRFLEFTIEQHKKKEG